MYPNLPRNCYLVTVNQLGVYKNSFKVHVFFVIQLSHIPFFSVLPTNAVKGAFCVGVTVKNQITR